MHTELTGDWPKAGLAPNEPNEEAAGAACVRSSQSALHPSIVACCQWLAKETSLTPKPVLPKAGADAGVPKAGVEGCPKA